MGVEIGEGDGLYAVRNIFGSVDMTYGLIAEYLSDTDAVSYTLDFISRDLWLAYNDPLYINTKGRFTRALRQVAANYGFIYNDFVVYTGPLDPPTFMPYIQNGYFWKDSFAPAHGEYSHAYQWLCIARHFRGRGGANIPALYRDTANIHAEEKIVAVVGGAEKLAGRVRMWPWLCDCFPYSRYPSSPEFSPYKDTLRHTYSDSCRCPNTIERTARASKSSFIGLIANYRSSKGMLDAKIIKPRVQDYYKTLPDYNRRGRQFNNINLISQAQTLRKERLGHFTAKDNDPSIRVFSRAAPIALEQAIPQRSITLHGIAGQIPEHVFTNAPEPLVIGDADNLRNFYTPKNII